MVVVQCDLIKLHTAPHSVVQFTITCGAVQLLLLSPILVDLGAAMLFLITS